MSARRWWWRLALGAVVFGVLQTLFVLTELEPDALRLGLLVALATAALGLALEALAVTGPVWDTEPVPAPSLQAQDPRMARYLSLLEGQTTASTPTGAVRDRLALLVEQVLRRRHGLTRTDPAARDLLGPELTAVLTGAPRRLDPAELDRCLARIEAL